MKKVLIIGSDGQLGSDLFLTLDRNEGFEVFTLNHSQIEITDKSSVDRLISNANPDIVINCAAYVRGR